MTEIDNKLVDAKLGNGLYKKRIGRSHCGKRDGFRTILAYRELHRAVFIFGFAKNENDNIDEDQLSKLKKLAKYYLAISEDDINALVTTSKLVEVNYDDY